MANFLGIEKNKKRVKRFWAELAITLGPYILKPVGEAIAHKISGNIDQHSLQMYDGYIKELYNSQKELDNKLDVQATMFKVDSERKNFQITWLERTQHALQNNIKMLQSTIATNAEEKENKIKDLQAMLDETTRKIKAQKDIQNKLVKDVNDISDKLRTVDDDIKYIKNKVSMNSENVDVVQTEAKINSISLNFNFLLSRFENEQKTLFDVIKNANDGRLDPYIVTPLSLIEMMEKAQAMLPENTKFPFYPNFTNAQKLYTVIKPIVYLYDNKIMFILTIPVVNGKTFSLHKITSLPIPVKEDNFAFVLPKQPYLVVDRNNEDYTMLSRENFREFCKAVSRNLYLCDQIRRAIPVHSSPDCEMTLFLNSRNIPDSCDRRLMHLEKPVFLQLQEPMSWIYASPESSLVITCDKHRETVNLKGSGFIKINRSCSAHTLSNSLFTVARFTSNTISSFSPHVNISDSIDLSNVGAVEENRANYREIIAPFDYKELEAMSVRYSNSDNGDLPMFSIFLTILLIGVVVFLILWIYKKFKK